MEERTQTFDEKLVLLLEKAKQRKNVLENREILDFFVGEILDPEKLDRIYDYLDNNKVDVLRLGEDDEIDPDLFIEDEIENEEEINVEEIDLSVPRRGGDGGSCADVSKGDRQDPAFNDRGRAGAGKTHGAWG